MTYMITGFDPKGRSAYYRRNIGTLAAALALFQCALDAGWTRVEWSRETF